MAQAVIRPGYIAPAASCSAATPEARLLTRPAAFAVACLLACSLVSCDLFQPESGDGSVRVGRDDRGMAHVYADSLYGLYYGYGHSIAEDRLFQLDSTIRTVRGQAAQAFGARYLSTDKHVLHNTDYPSISAQIAELPESEPQAYEMLAGFVAGINAYIDWCVEKPGQRLPVEYGHFGIKPFRWTVEDAVLLYVGTMAYRYADFNYELANLDFLRALERQHGKEKAWSIFNAAYPLNVPGSPTTVPASPNEVPTKTPSPKRPAHLDELLDARAPTMPIFDEDGRAFADWNDDTNRAQLERAGQQWRLGRESASNVWMIRAPRLSDAQAVLVNGPQFNFVNPSYVYGVALHGKEFKLFGNSLYGYANLLFAHNGHIGWGSTAGFGDQVDIFQLAVHPEKPDQYYFDGQWRSLQKRRHQIEVKDEQAVDFISHWTDIGPVMARANTDSGSAIYVRRRAWQNQSVRSLVQWLKLPLARNQAEFTEALSQFTLSINFYYIDTGGQIGYIHGGVYPARTDEHDNRLPLSLGIEPGRDWQDIRPFPENPQHFDPVDDYMTNWNNRPSTQWRNSDVWWAKWSLSDRVGVLNRDIEARQEMTVDDSWGLVERSSFADLNYPHLSKLLVDALAERDDANSSALMEQLGQWNERWSDNDADGYYDSPACAWMQTWLPILLKDVFSDDIPEDELTRFVITGYPINDIGPLIAESMGVSIVVRTHAHGAEALGYDFLNGRSLDEIVRVSVASAMQQAIKEYGSAVDQWRLANPGWRFHAVNFRGVPTGMAPMEGPEAQMNRGSENNMFVVRDGRMRGYDVVPPGQNAYKADQMDAFFSFEKYPLGEDLEEADFDKLVTLEPTP